MGFALVVAATGAATGAGAAAGAGAGTTSATAGAPAPAGAKAEISSPFAPTTAMLVRTGTSSPTSQKIAKTSPATSA